MSYIKNLVFANHFIKTACNPKNGLKCLYIDGKKVIINPPPTPGGGGELTTDVEVIGVTVGNVTSGYTFTAGMTPTEVLTKIMQPTLPIYKEPTVGLTINNSLREVGSLKSYTIDVGFTQNDAGVHTQVKYYKDGTAINTSNNMQYIHTNQVVKLGTVVYKAEVTYNQGPIKNDNSGTPDPNGRINGGTIDSSINVKGSYYNTYNPFAVIETDGAVIKAGSIKTFNSSFTVNTGTTLNYIIITIPATKTITSIKDLDALGADLLANYVLTNIDMPDGKTPIANQIASKKYVLTLSSPYPANHRHKVTIS